jgi:pimeloyl-ACP methyl ester carboxylesterase
MDTYVLVHGAWMSAWGWHKIVPLLEAAGHKVITPELPGHGTDKTPADKASLQAYTDTVVKVLDPQNEPVILVGHSMAGTVISQVAEARPDKVKTLVYLTAYLLTDGQSLFAAAQSDPESLVPTILVVEQDKGIVGLREDGLQTVFFNDCTAEDVAAGLAHYQPDPLVPLATPVSITEANYGRVPRIYIECSQDKVISPALQRTMYTTLPCQQILTLDAGHAGFLSKPTELVALLTTL